MKIGQYVKEYTLGNNLPFKYVVMEVEELLVEISKLNKDGVKEEFEDVFHFLQIWLYWHFHVNGEIWGITKHSVKKFMDRKLVWNSIYEYVGLPRDISGYVGNYKKREKVVSHLKKFEVSKEKAEDAYKKIVLEK
jgi:hypothetical protein